MRLVTFLALFRISRDAARARVCEHWPCVHIVAWETIKGEHCVDAQPNRSLEKTQQKCECEHARVHCSQGKSRIAPKGHLTGPKQ
jgi:hypothetical protein